MKPSRIVSFVLLVVGAWAAGPGAAARPAPMARYYRVETIATPRGLVPECNGIDFLPDGRLAAVFDHGEAYFYNPATKVWRRFAEGLHTPMGVLAISERELVVTQRAELTRLIDHDGSGKADEYRCISDGWGLSGNYDEFPFNVVRDSAGNFYVPLASAGGGGPRYETRGRVNPDGFARAGHYSPVPYRGWVVRITPQGELTGWASGFREPNGIGIDPHGRIFVTDNQGDWIGTSPLHYLQEGHFYGHPPALVWRSDFRPGRSLLELDKLRTPGAVLFPHAILANSPGQPVFDLTGGKFGAFAGQMFVPEFNVGRILRVMLEDVAGEIQGAATTFYDGAPLRSSNIRLAFAPDGSLWTAQSQRQLGWPGEQGIQRLAWSGQTPLDVREMHLTPTGFDFDFTLPVNPASVGTAAFPGQRYYYVYHSEYGSPRTDIHPIGITRIAVSPDGRRVSLDVDALQPGYIYEFDLKGITAADGSPLVNRVIAYTVNRLRDGTVLRLPRPPPTGEQKGGGHDQPEGAKRGLSLLGPGGFAGHAAPG